MIARIGHIDRHTEATRQEDRKGSFSGFARAETDHGVFGGDLRYRNLSLEIKVQGLVAPEICGFATASARCKAKSVITVRSDGVVAWL
jgi:hypothetical protein